MPFRSLGLKLQLIVQRRIERISQWARDEEQVEIQERLHQVFKTLVIFCHHEIYVNPQKIPELAVYPFDPENLASPALHFFQPWSTTQLAKYEKNLDTDETKMHLAYLEETIQMAHVATVHAFRPHVLEELEYIIKRLVWELETCPRRDTRNDSRPLSSITNWKISSGAKMHWWFKMVNLDEKSDPTWHCYHSWEISKVVPHVKVIMALAAPTHPDLLFKAELLTITSVMVSRMKMRSLRKEAVVPVMLFSLSGPKHGRILTAHCDGTKIVVYRSPAYRFFPEDNSSLQLFTRYLASDVKPFGETNLWQK